MEKPVVISVENLSKKFSLQTDSTFKEFAQSLVFGKQWRKVFWALKDVSFAVKKNESVGIIGPNGSGKSTIMKLLSGVTTPTTGKITIKGSVSSLIELGAGFHPDLSGRENVFLNGLIFGMSKKEIEGKFDSIVGFSEIEKFIDEPVKHYSSGMYLRLGFAVAVHTDPEILLVDEILSVGDAHFQEKCLRKIEEIKKSGTTIVLISHSRGLIQDHTERVLLLIDGQLRFDGAPQKGFDKYEEILTEREKANGKQ